MRRIMIQWSLWIVNVLDKIIRSHDVQRSKFSNLTGPFRRKNFQNNSLRQNLNDWNDFSTSGNRNPQNSSSRFQSFRNNLGNREITCWKCGKIGHLSSNCFSFIQSENYGNSQFKNFLNNKMNSRNGKNVLWGNKKGSQ